MLADGAAWSAHVGSPNKAFRFEWVLPSIFRFMCTYMKFTHSSWFLLQHCCNMVAECISLGKYQWWHWNIKSHWCYEARFFALKSRNTYLFLILLFLKIYLGQKLLCFFLWWRTFAVYLVACIFWFRLLIWHVEWYYSLQFYSGSGLQSGESAWPGVAILLCNICITLAYVLRVLIRTFAIFKYFFESSKYFYEFSAVGEFFFYLSDQSSFAWAGWTSPSETPEPWLQQRNFLPSKKSNRNLLGVEGT